MKVQAVSNFHFIYFLSSLGISIAFYHCQMKVLFRSYSRHASSFRGYKAAPAPKGDAYAIARDELNKKIKMPSIILVSPFLDKNVGSVSRAMLNFGLTDLRLVAPRCDHLSPDAMALAAGSKVSPNPYPYPYPSPYPYPAGLLT